jgi:ABC-type sugar transport system substrate-binding protein
MKLSRTIGILILVVLVIGLLMACTVQLPPPQPAQAPAAPAASEEELAVEAQDWPLVEDVKLCWITALGHPYGVAKTEIGAKEAALFGFTLDIYDSTQDIQTEISLVEDCVAKQYDVIIMTPYDPTALNSAIEKAVDAGIPVISEGAALDEEGTALVSTTIGSNGILEGIAAGELICEALGETGGNWVMIEGAPGHALVPQRGGEAEKVVAEQCPSVSLLAKETGEWDRAKSRTVMENFLTAYPDQIDLVYCHDGNMCFGAEEAVKEAGLMDQIKIIGINGNQEEYDAIKSGDWYGTILNDASWISINAVQRSRDLVENRPILKEYISPADKVTQENVDEFTAWW